VLGEPRRRELGDAFERPRLLEQMRRSGDDLEPRLASHPSLRLPVELEDLPIGAADDQ